MRVLIATTQAPFMYGGAELLTSGLLQALAEHGHRAELVQFPFRYGAAHGIRHSMRAWSAEDFEALAGSTPDVVISLKFPSYYARHPNHVLWLLHQHRSAYELWHDSNDADELRLREEIHAEDRQALSRISRRYTISERVRDRLLDSCGLIAEVLPPPPFNVSHFHSSGQALPYVFFPSRLESLKRQDLLIRAMQHVTSNAVALFSGEGGQADRYRQLVNQLGLSGRVKFLGRIDDAQLAAFYANATCVFFGPYDEDYGYVTVEAMLSAKPVITCTDSGGPLQLVVDGVTGHVVEPTPVAVAAAIDALFANPDNAKRMGRNGEERIRSMDLSWNRVVSTLLA